MRKESMNVHTAAPLYNKKKLLQGEKQKNWYAKKATFPCVKRARRTDMELSVARKLCPPADKQAK